MRRCPCCVVCRCRENRCTRQAATLTLLRHRENTNSYERRRCTRDRDAIVRRATERLADERIECGPVRSLKVGSRKDPAALMLAVHTLCRRQASTATHAPTSSLSLYKAQQGGGCCCGGGIDWLAIRSERIRNSLFS
jgi:hypothetical protein